MLKIRSLLLLCCLIMTAFTITAAQDTPPDCPGMLPSRLYSAAYARVLPGRANNLRANPGISGEKIGELPPHAIVQILDAPTCANGYLWWYVGYPNANDIFGWTAEGDGTDYWIEPYIHPEPETLLTPEDTEDLAVVEVEYRGISFSIDRSIGAGVTVEHVFPNYIWDSMRSPSAGNPTPYGLKFTFVNAEGESSGIMLKVFALADFANLPDGLPSTFGMLSSMLEPDAELNTEPVYEMFLLPDRIAPVLFQDVFRPIDFQNGRGLSYFAQYSYAADPIVALIYTYTGLTSDGLYYVTLQRPVTTDLLPDLATDDYDQDDWEAFYDNFDAYRAQIADSLRTASPDDFTPSLAPIDALIASINIQAPQE